MSKIVSVTRILNEDDIVECFVRHNSCHVDHMLLLDDGSTDRTLAILRALKEEGLPLTIFSSPSVTFDEFGKNTWAYQAASQLFGAGWVVFIDADEFISTPGSVLLRALLPPGAQAIKVRLVNYGQTEGDDLAEIIVPKRLRWQNFVPTNVHKLMLRGGLPDIVIGGGNHCAYDVKGQLPAEESRDIAYAHYPRRNGWQILQKIAAGWLKVTASGHDVVNEGHSSHYRSPFATLRDKPEEILYSKTFFTEEFPLSEAVEAPLDYLGGNLKYYEHADPAAKSVRIFLNAVEALAMQHGRLLDELPDAKNLVQNWNNSRRFLF
jgi:glycosyltransferase involved in cell wall biosynthesis